MIQAFDPEHVVVKLYLPGEAISQDHSRAQIESAKVNGRSVGGYFWCYRSFDPRKSVADAIELARSCGLELPILWHDVEPYPEGDELPDAAWLWKAIRECQKRSVKPGIYTGAWVWSMLGNTTEFADAGIPVWAAQPDGVADVAVFTPFGGWKECVGKQYAVVPFGAGQIDLDVFKN